VRNLTLRERLERQLDLHVNTQQNLLTRSKVPVVAHGRFAGYPSVRAVTTENGGPELRGPRTVLQH
jgi:hypothetical protein